MTAIAFIRKEFIHIARDWRTTLIAIIMPVVLMLIFGFAISTEVNNIDVVAVVPHMNEDIRQQLEAVDASQYITYRGLTDQAHIRTVLQDGTADAVIVYSDEQGENGPKYQLVLDGADANISATANIYLQQALNASNPATASAMAAMSKGIITTVRYNPQLLSAYNFVPGVMGMLFILICALMTSASIVREKETGTMEILFVSPIRPQMIIVAKIIPFFVISLVDLTLILLMVHFMMGVPLESLGGIITISTLYILLALSIGILVSTIATKQVTALLVCAMVFMVPVMMFSGMLFPVDNMPTILKPFPYIIPARWYIDAMRKLMIEGVPFRMVLKEFLILLGMLVVLLSVALKRFKDKLD